MPLSAQASAQGQLDRCSVGCSLLFVAAVTDCVAAFLACLPNTHTHRYLELLREGAQHWKLDGRYTSWLLQHPDLADSGDRGPAYYTSPTGQPLPAWPKIRTGGSQSSGGGGRGGGRGRGGRGGGGGKRGRQESL